MREKLNPQQLLQQLLRDLTDSKTWLQRSYTLCEKIGIKETYTPEEFDAFENLTSRFARTCDFLINKVYRGFDKLELTESGSLLDVINRADKRHLITSVAEIKTIKELRNEISHQYASAQLKAIFKEVLAMTPTLFELVAKTQVYGGKLAEVIKS